MKLLLCMMMLFVGISPSAGSAAFVMSSPCAVYETADFSTPLTIAEQELKLAHGDSVVFLEEEGDFSKISFVFEGEECEGYVYSFYLTFNKVEQETYPLFNGKANKEGALLYDMNKNPTEHVVKKGQGVYLYQGYSSKKDFVAVGVVLEDGSMFYGLMESSAITPNGVNGGLITGIVVIASCLTIIFLLLFMKKKKRQ